MICPTCGKDRAPELGRECRPCAGRWERAQRSRAFLPTVPMFPPAELPEPPPAPRVEPRPVRGAQLDAFDLDLFGG